MQVVRCEVTAFSCILSDTMSVNSLGVFGISVPAIISSVITSCLLPFPQYPVFMSILWGFFCGVGHTHEHLFYVGDCLEVRHYFTLLLK